MSYGIGFNLADLLSRALTASTQGTATLIDTEDLNAADTAALYDALALPANARLPVRVFSITPGSISGAVPFP